MKHIGIVACSAEGAALCYQSIYREAVTLHRLCGLSHAEIAERMNRSEGAVRNLVYRGISRLALLVDADPG